MNGPIRQKLGIIPKNVTWGGVAVFSEYSLVSKKPKTHLPYLVFTVRPGQAEEVFSNMAGDFMRPVVEVVGQLLSAGVNVTVYNGQLDLIVDTMGVHRRPHERPCC